MGYQRVFGRWTRWAWRKDSLSLQFYDLEHSYLGACFYAMTSYDMDRTFPHFMILQLRKDLGRKPGAHFGCLYSSMIVKCLHQGFSYEGLNLILSPLDVVRWVALTWPLFDKLWILGSYNISRIRHHSEFAKFWSRAFISNYHAL